MAERSEVWWVVMTMTPESSYAWVRLQYEVDRDALSLIYCTFSLWPWCLVFDFFVLTPASAPNHNQPTHSGAHLCDNDIRYLIIYGKPVITIHYLSLVHLSLSLLSLCVWEGLVISRNALFRSGPVHRSAIIVGSICQALGTESLSHGNLKLDKVSQSG